MKLGKETFLKKFHKNKLEINLNAILEHLSDDKYEIQIFGIDEGQTDQDIQFYSCRFYFKEKPQDNKPEIPNYQEILNRERVL